MKVEELLENNNIKLTKARKALLEILLYENKPLSYEDIKDNISMDKATFYRNITIFEEGNLITSFESNSKKRYFEILEKSNHAHFICNTCNDIECIKGQLALGLDGYDIQNVTITGTCKLCRI